MSLKENVDRYAIKVIVFVAGVALMIMMGAVVVNVFGRTVFSRPLYGMVEIVSLAGVFCVSFAIGYTERNRSHIVIIILISRLPKRLRFIFTLVCYCFSLCMIALLAWGGFTMGFEDAITPGATTYVLHLNKAPFRFTWVLGCLMLGFFLLRNLIETLDQVRKK